MDVSSLMTTDVVTIPPDADLAAAMVAMDECDIRHLPVVSGGELVGVLSDRELLDATGWLAGAARRFDVEHVDDLMKTEPETISPADTVVMASVQLATKGVGCLPVVGDDGRLVGMLTETDLLTAWRDTSRRARREPERDPPVAERMTSPVHTVTPTTLLGEARALFAEHRVRHMPVVDDGGLVGILSDRDLRRAHGAGRSDDLPCKSLMTPELVTTRSGAKLSEAATAMADEAVSALPVVDGGRLVGIVTLRDVVDHAIDELREVEG